MARPLSLPVVPEKMRVVPEKMRILGNAADLREEYSGSFKWEGLNINAKVIEAPRPICVVPFDHPHYANNENLTVDMLEDLVRTKIEGDSRNDVAVRRSTWLAFSKYFLCFLFLAHQPRMDFFGCSARRWC